VPEPVHDPVDGVGDAAGVLGRDREVVLSRQEEHSTVVGVDAVELVPGVEVTRVEVAVAGVDAVSRPAVDPGGLARVRLGRARPVQAETPFRPNGLVIDLGSG
jgi:hypothetical protein